MSIQFPDLAARTYKDILDEMVFSIPKYSEKWTNHNPSDPGITILEILAWIFDTNLYRVNRIPEESYINFIRLIAGAAGEEVDILLQELKKDANSDRSHIEILEFLKEIEENKSTEKSIKSINEMKAAALRFINSNYRAVTKDNFKELAIEATWNRNEEDPKVKRAIVYGSPDGKVEIIIISNRLDKYSDLKKIVKDYLEPRKLICTKIIVKEPVYTSVKIYIEVVCLPHMRTDRIVDKVKKNILDFLDPLTGGDDKNGWPYGRMLTIFEIFHIVEETEGIDHADNVILDDEPGLKNKKIEGLIHPVNISIKVAGKK